jgi:hypothetical protein
MTSQSSETPILIETNDIEEIFDISQIYKQGLLVMFRKDSRRDVVGVAHNLQIVETTHCTRVIPDHLEERDIHQPWMRSLRLLLLRATLWHQTQERLGVPHLNEQLKELLIIELK